MDAREMQYQVELKLRQIDEVDDRYYLSADIEDWLNEANRIVLRNQYEVFETSEKARKALANLVTNTNISDGDMYTANANLENGIFAPLPSNFLYTVSEEATVNLDSTGTVTTNATDYTRILVKPITHDEYKINKDNPYKKPYRKLCWRIDYKDTTGSSLTATEAKTHELITDGNYIVKNYHVRYVKFPDDISISSDTSTELAEIVHDDIVNTAVELGLRYLMIKNNDTEQNRS